MHVARAEHGGKGGVLARYLQHVALEPQDLTHEDVHPVLPELGVGVVHDHHLLPLAQGAHELAQAVGVGLGQEVGRKLVATRGLREVIVRTTHGNRGRVGEHLLAAVDQMGFPAPGNASHDDDGGPVWNRAQAACRLLGAQLPDVFKRDLKMDATLKHPASQLVPLGFRDDPLRGQHTQVVREDCAERGKAAQRVADSGQPEVEPVALLPCGHGAKVKTVHHVLPHGGLSVLLVRGRADGVGVKLAHHRSIELEDRHVGRELVVVPWGTQACLLELLEQVGDEALQCWFRFHLDVNESPAKVIDSAECELQAWRKDVDELGTRVVQHSPGRDPVLLRVESKHAQRDVEGVDGVAPLRQLRGVAAYVGLYLLHRTLHFHTGDM